ncbi:MULTISPECIES: histidine phosphatase family protein [Microbulbifer]|uniref:Histidine phosphatase family protein n=1 Tax=Microbulbifer celer TaxID=435905 RepID=A0ABW3UBU0_9GAMM|nr:MULTISPECIES: histidine phosphatase family protein [Microbulbifer]UFN55784.1 histidine phosphatase family protein [Microbulbifer celer]
MHRIILIRHGEAAKSNTDADPRLTELGQQQAHELASWLDSEFPGGSGVKLVSSPKARALQTAFPTADRWQCEVREEPAVVEVPSPQGVGLAKRGHWIKQLLAGSWNTLEPAQQVWREGLINYLKSHQDSNHHVSLVFCHFMVINAVVAALRNDDKVAQFYPDYTSCTELALKDGDLEIVKLGRERTQEKNRIQ